MKIFQKISIVLIVAVIASFTLGTVSTNISMAAGGQSPTDVMENVTGSSDDIDTSGLTDVAGKILTFLQVISGVFAIIMIAVTGFRYIIETADVKKELKQSMLPIIIGILLVFFATSIAKFIVNIFKK